MRSLILLAGAALMFGASCSERTSPEPDVPLRADCGHDPDCIQIAFTGFRGERAELKINGQLVFDGTLQTLDWTTESSGSAEFMSGSLDYVRLKIDEKIVFEQPVTELGVRTIYVQPQEPYIRLTDHPGPLLD